MAAKAQFEATETWKTACTLIKLLGPLPSSVTDATGVIWQLDMGDELAWEEGLAALALFDKSGALRKPLCQAAAALGNNSYRLDRPEALSTSLLVRILEPKLFAALLALVYLHKRLAKICPAPQWELLAQEYVAAVELAYIFGAAAVKVSQPLLVLAAGLRYTALGVLLLRDPPAYAEYRLNCKRFDGARELSLWQAEHGTVAAALAAQLRLPVDKEAFARSLGYTKNPPKDLSEDYRLLNSALFWVESLKANNRPTLSHPHSEQLGLTELQITDSRQRIMVRQKEGSQFDWLLSNKKV